MTTYHPLRPRPSNKRRRGRYFPPIQTRLTSGPFPGDGDEFIIGPKGQTLRIPSYYAMSGYAIIPNHYQQKPAASSVVAVVPEEEESSPSATSWAATIPSPNATKSSPAEQITASPSSPLSLNWFCRNSINKHFPVKKGFGGRVPPIHWRGSKSQMTVWRRMTRKEVRRFPNVEMTERVGRQYLASYVGIYESMQSLTLNHFSFYPTQQDEEWSRWSTLPYEIRKEKTQALERIQTGATLAEAAAEDDSPKPDPPQHKIALTFNSSCQTDEQLLEFRDVADEVIIDRLSKRVKTNDGKAKAAPPAPMPTKPRSKPQSPKPPVAEVTVASKGITPPSPSPSRSKGRAPTASAARPSQAPPTFGNRHPYGLAPRYSSYHDPRGHFSYHHHMSPPQSRVLRPETNNDGSRNDARRSLFDVAAHRRPATPKTSANRQINDEEYDRIQRNESARHLIRLLL